MSAWKAYASVRAVPSNEHEQALLAAYETLHLVSDALGVDRSERELLDAIEELKRDVKAAEEDQASAEADREEAELRLERKLQSPAEERLEALQAERDEAVRERDEVLRRLAKVEPLLDAYSDQLAMARRFVSAAEGAGVKVRHVRKART